MSLKCKPSHINIAVVSFLTLFIHMSSGWVDMPSDLGTDPDTSVLLERYDTSHLQLTNLSVPSLVQRLSSNLPDLHVTASDEFMRKPYNFMKNVFHWRIVPVV